MFVPSQTFHCMKRTISCLFIISSSSYSTPLLKALGCFFFYIGFWSINTDFSKKKKIIRTFIVEVLKPIVHNDPKKNSSCGCGFAYQFLHISDECTLTKIINSQWCTCLNYFIYIKKKNLTWWICYKYKYIILNIKVIVNSEKNCLVGNWISLLIETVVGF